jgi:oligopeptide/dipeptide ABC transporter ATP-binding protein
VRAGGTGGTLGRAGAAMLVVLFAGAALAPLVTRYDPGARVGLSHQRPSLEHLLGTNDVGQDLFTQLVFGARISLTIGVLAAVIAVAVGLVVALLAGYLGGTVDAALMRVVDLTLAFPFIPLVLVVAAFLGRGLLTTVLVIGAVIWAQPARVLRSQVLKALAFGHVEAARGMGASTPRVLVRHLLPRIAPLAAAQFVRAANVAITLEAALSFLGLGDPARLSWGSMLFHANAHNAILTDAWRWWILPPGIALTVTVLGLAFVGFAFEEWGDRRLTGGASTAERRRWAAARRTDRGGAPPRPGLALEVRGLRVDYRTPQGPVHAVRGVDVEVPAGRLVGLVGASGCGKTTLAMTILGLLPTTAQVVDGQVIVDGVDLTAMPGPEVARLRGRVMSLVPQSAMNALNPAYTARQQVVEAASLTRTAPEARARADELFELVDLPPAKARAYPHELSGGMRQRVALAMALANDPSLIVADEPLTGLDVITQARIVRLFLEVQERTGVTILLVSHDLPLVSRVATHLLVMDGGRIVDAGDARALTGSPAHPSTRELFSAFPSLHGPSGAGDGGPPTTREPARSPVLELRGVSRTYRSHHGLRSVEATRAVRELDLTVGRGEIVALVGESGAGKSTAGRLALGLERPDRGQVLLDGVDLSTLGRRERLAVRRRTHLILQDPYHSLHPSMSVLDLVAEPLAIARTPRRDRAPRVLAALEEVALTPADRFLRRYPHELSGGQRQRVAFARALASEPELVVADEPVSMLDVALQVGILDLIRDLGRRHGITFVFVTHDLAVARHLADRIGVMYRGRLVELGPADDVVDGACHPYTRALLAAVEQLAPPPMPVDGLPPGGQPCQRHGRCDPSSQRCRDERPTLLEIGPGHLCATHVVDEPLPIR